MLYSLKSGLERHVWRWWLGHGETSPLRTKLQRTVARDMGTASKETRMREKIRIASLTGGASLRRSMNSSSSISASVCNWIGANHDLLGMQELLSGFGTGRPARFALKLLGYVLGCGTVQYSGNGMHMLQLCQHLIRVTRRTWRRRTLNVPHVRGGLFRGLIMIHVVCRAETWLELF